MPLLPLQADLVYGPVRSRRLGHSLGVNILPADRKICNFNCAYCQYGWTPDWMRTFTADEWPSAALVAEAVKRALGRERETGGSVDTITLAGNGEPTLHPGFAAVVDRLRDVRASEWPAARLVVLTNGGTLDRADVVAALRHLDEAYVKLDSGDPRTFARLNGAAREALPVVIAGLRALPHVTIQALFTRDQAGKIDNTTPEAIDMWMAALEEIRPSGVHVYSLDRAPAWSQLQAVPRAELEAIAARVRQAGISAQVF